MKPIIIHSSTSTLIPMSDMGLFTFAIIKDEKIKCHTGKLVWRVSQDCILDMTGILTPTDCWGSGSTLLVQPVQVKMTLEVL